MPTPQLLQMRAEVPLGPSSPPGDAVDYRSLAEFYDAADPAQRAAHLQIRRNPATFLQVENIAIMFFK